MTLTTFGALPPENSMEEIDMTEDKISVGIENFLEYIRRTEQLYHISIANEQEANDATQDLLHSLELEEHDYHSSARIARKLKEVRQTRRAAKDLTLKAQVVVNWIDENRKTIKTLEQLLGEVRKVERNTENRIYTPKTSVIE